MSELDDLYQEMILDHNRKPRNFRAMEGAARKADGYNPICGDKVTVFVRLDGGRIADVSFVGSGCAISKASASIMTEAVKGKSRAEAEALFKTFHTLVTREPGAAGPEAESLGNLAVFAGVSEFPVRVKCATLSWHALKAALAGEAGLVTTEAPRDT